MKITNKIHFRNLKGDLFGAIAAAAIALPMALTFGVASGAIENLINLPDYKELKLIG